MKLTIEHLKGYLNTGLKMYEIRTKEIFPFLGISADENLFKGGDSEYDWWSIDGFLPILTRVEDMSDEQLKELQCLWFGLSRDIYEETFDEIRFGVKDIKRNITQGSGVRYSTFKNNKHVQTGTLSFEMLNVYQFNYLHSQHIDIHGLIENGLAIDSKTLNP